MLDEGQGDVHGGGAADTDGERWHSAPRQEGYGEEGDGLADHVREEGRRAEGGIAHVGDEDAREAVPAEAAGQGQGFSGADMEKGYEKEAAGEGAYRGGQGHDKDLGLEESALQGNARLDELHADKKQQTVQGPAGDRGNVDVEIGDENAQEKSGEDDCEKEGRAFKIGPTEAGASEASGIRRWASVSKEEGFDDEESGYRAQDREDRCGGGEQAQLPESGREPSIVSDAETHGEKQGPERSFYKRIHGPGLGRDLEAGEQGPAHEKTYKHEYLKQSIHG